MGLLTQEDSMLFRQFFKEMTMLRGISVDYIYPVDETTTIHGQIFPKFSSITKLDIIFESSPKVKTLKNYGWVSESNEDKPYIAYLPYDTPHIQTKSRIKIYPIGSGKDGKWFEITNIQESIEFPDAYICKLAPVFETAQEKSNYNVTNNNYIDGDNQPDQPTNHNKEINKDLEEHIEDNLKKDLQEDENFTFLKIN